MSTRSVDEARTVSDLVEWFDVSARPLPWRRTRDPYAIWLSEIMAQQTRVETVWPYYERFLRRFPTVQSLASAPESEVLAMWSGLGYYRRARQLHLAAREITERFGGALPSAIADLRSLSGVGAYTAGAIASIAFDRPEPLVDGNVARVLSRIFALEDDIKSTAGQRALWATAARLVPASRPGAFNQALMELGALVCTPRSPSCGICPVAERCLARAAGRQAELPRVGAKVKPTPVDLVAVVVRAGERVLLGERHRNGLFGGLWEPPMIEAPSLEEARPTLRELGVDVALTHAGSVKHTLSHRLMRIQVYAGRTPRAARMSNKSNTQYVRLAWYEPSAPDLGVSTMAKKVLGAARAAHQ